jgi:hypothetical protein
MRLSKLLALYGPRPGCGGGTHHLGVDAGEAPHVDGGGVELGAEQDLGRAVPQRDHLVREGAHGDAEGARQPEVRELHVPLRVHQQVLRLQVAVQHALPVAVRYPFQKLGQVALNGTYSFSMHIKLQLFQTLYPASSHVREGEAFVGQHIMATDIKETNREKGRFVESTNRPRVNDHF